MLNNFDTSEYNIGLKFVRDRLSRVRGSRAVQWFPCDFHAAKDEEEKWLKQRLSGLLDYYVCRVVVALGANH